MNTNYLHYKVESAFNCIEDALIAAAEHATPEGKTFYSRLMDELVGVRDRARQELLELHTKKAAPAAGTTETATKDSDKESTFSLEENPENVKRSSLALTVVDDNTVEVQLCINGPRKHLLNIYSSAVEVITSKAPELDLMPEELEAAHKRGVDRAMEHLEKKTQRMFSELNESSKDALLRLARELNLPDDFLRKFTEGVEK